MTRIHSGPLWPELGLYILLLMMISFSSAAPLQETTEIAESSQLGCYYNYNRYSEGDRILTNEPCLNCTCHNKMLMCYLRVCPFTKPIGQDCIIEKREDQCCPIITCPEVPVELLEHNAGQQSTSLASPDRYGCSIDSKFYPDGAQLPSNPRKPCELCYCIRNMTSCVMQECTLHVDGCRPIYNKGVCCPVRYNCDHDDIDESMLLEDMSTTTMRPTEGFIITTTMPTPQITDCIHDGEMYADGALLTSEKPCEHCYCMRGDIVCAVQECGTPMENEGKNCTVIATKEGQCCPEYKCDTASIDSSTETTEIGDVSSATTVGIPIGDIQTTIQPQEQEQELLTTELSKELDVTTSVPSSDMDDVHNEIEHDEVIDEKHTTQTSPITSSSSSSSSTTSTSVSDEITTDSYDELQAGVTTVQPTLLSSSSTSPTGELDHRIENEQEGDSQQQTTEGFDIPSDDKDLQEHIDDDDHVTTEKKQLSESQTQLPDEDDDKQTVTTTRPAQQEIDEEPEDITVSSAAAAAVATAATTVASIGTMATGDDDKSDEKTTVKFDEPITTAQSIIDDDSDIDINTVIPSIVPGEGYCLVDGKSYKNNSAIPSTSKCEIACVCVNSIVQCESIKCPPPPAHVLNCQPIYDEQKSCCPTYDCSSDSTERIDIDKQITDRTPDLTETTSIKSLDDNIVTEMPIVAHDIKQDDVKKPITDKQGEEDTSTESDETAGKPSDDEQSTEMKPSDDEQSTELKPSGDEQSTERKPSDDEQSTESKPSDDEQSTESKPIIVMDDGTTESISQTEKIPHSIDTATEPKLEDKTESSPMLINVEDETATDEHKIDDSTTEGIIKHDQDEPMMIIVEDETKKSVLDEQVTDKPMLIVVDDITTSADVSESQEVTKKPVDTATDTPSIDFKVDDDMTHTTMPQIIVDDDEQTPTESSSPKSPVDDDKEGATTDILPGEPSQESSTPTDSTSDLDITTRTPAAEIPSDDHRTDKPEDLDITTSIPSELSTKPSESDDEQELSITPSILDKSDELQPTPVTSSPTDDSGEPKQPEELTTFGSIIKDEDDKEKSTVKSPQFDEIDVTTLSSMELSDDKSEQPEIIDDDKQISPTTVSSEQDMPSETATDKKPQDSDILNKEPVDSTVAPASVDDSATPLTATDAAQVVDTDEVTEPAKEDTSTKVSPTEEEPKEESSTQITDDEDLKESKPSTEPTKEEISTKLPETEEPTDKDHVTLSAEEETSTKVPADDLSKKPEQVTDASIDETSAAAQDEATTIASVKPDEIESQEPVTTDKIPMDLSQQPIDSATDKSSSTDSSTEYELPTSDKENDSTEIPDKHIEEPVTALGEEKPSTQDSGLIPTVPSDIETGTSVPVEDKDKPEDEDISQSTPAIPSKEHDEGISEPATTAQTVDKEEPSHEIVPTDDEKIQPTTLSSITESDKTSDTTGKPDESETEAESETKTPTEIDGTSVSPISDDSSVAPDSDDISATLPTLSEKPIEDDETVTGHSDNAATTVASIDFKTDDSSKTPLSDDVKPTEPSDEIESDGSSTEVPMEDIEQSKTEQPTGQEVSTPMYLPPIKDGETSPIDKTEPEIEEPIETPTEDSDIHKLEITTVSAGISESEITDKTSIDQESGKPTEEKPAITETDIPETTAKDIVPDSESHTVIPPESVNLMKGEDVTTVTPTVDKEEDVIIVTAISIPESTTKPKPLSDEDKVESPVTSKFDDKDSATDKSSDMSDVSTPTTTRPEQQDIESDTGKPIVVTVLPESVGDKSTVQPIESQSATDSSIPEDDKSILTESSIGGESDQKEKSTDKPITDDEVISTVPEIVTPAALEEDSSTPLPSESITEAKPQKDEISTDSPVSGEPSQTEQPKPSDIDTAEPIPIVPYLGETRPDSDKDISTVQTPIDEMSTDSIIDSSSDENITPSTEPSAIDSSTDDLSETKPDSSTDKETAPESVTMPEEQEMLTHKPIESTSETKPIAVEPISTDSPIDESSEQPEDKTELPLESEKDLPVTNAPETIESSTHAKPLADDEKDISVSTLLPELMAGQTSESVTKTPDMEADVTQSSEDDTAVTSTPEIAAKPEVTPSTEVDDSKPIDIGITTGKPDEKPISTDDTQSEIDVTTKQSVDEVATSKPEIEEDSTDLESLSDVHTEPSIPSDDTTDLMPIDKESVTPDIEGSGADLSITPATGKPSDTDDLGTEQEVTDKTPMKPSEEEDSKESGKPELPVDSITSKPDDHTEVVDVVELPTEASGEKESPEPIESDKSTITPITQLDDHTEGSGASTDKPELPVDKRTDTPFDESTTPSAVDTDEDHSMPSEEDLTSEKKTEAPYSQSTDKPIVSAKPESEDQATEHSVDTDDHTKQPEVDIGSEKETDTPLKETSETPIVSGKPQFDDQATELTDISVTDKPESIDVTSKSPSDDSMDLTTTKSDTGDKLTETPEASVTEKQDTLPIDIVTSKPYEEQPEITPSEQQTEQTPEKPAQPQTEQPIDEFELTTVKSDDLPTDEVKMGTEEPAQQITGRPVTDESIEPATDKYPEGLSSDKPTEEVTKTPLEEQPDSVTDKSSEEPPSDMATIKPTEEEPEDDLINLTTSSPTKDQPEISSEQQPIESATDKVSEDSSKPTEATSDLGEPTDLSIPSVTDKLDDSVTDKINVLPELDEQVTDKSSEESTDDKTETPSSEKTDKPVEQITEKAPISPVECTSESCSINLSENAKPSTTEKALDATTLSTIIETATDAVAKPHDDDIDISEPVATLSQIPDDVTTISSAQPSEDEVTVKSDELLPPVTSGPSDVDDDGAVTTAKPSDILLVDEKTVATPSESTDEVTSLPLDHDDESTTSKTDESYSQELDHRIDDEKVPSITKKPTTKPSIDDIDVTTVEIVSDSADTTVKTPILPAQDQEPVTTEGSGQHDDDSDATTAKAPIELEKGSDATEPTADDKHPEPHADDIDVTTAAAAIGAFDEGDTTVKVPMSPTQEPTDKDQEPAITPSTTDDKHPEVSAEDIDVTTTAAISGEADTTVKAPISPAQPEVSFDDSDATTTAAVSGEADTTVKAPISPAQSEVTAEDSDATTTATITGEADTTIKAPISPAQPEVSFDDSDATTTAAISGEADTTAKAPISPAQSEVIDEDSDVTTTAAISGEADTTVKAPISPAHPEVSAEDIDVTTTAAITGEADTTVKAPISPVHPEVSVEDSDATTTAAISGEADTTVKAPISPAHPDVPVEDSDATTTAAIGEAEPATTPSTTDDKHPEVSAEDIDVTTAAAISGESDTTVKAPISPAQPEVSFDDSDATTTAAVSGEADTTVKAPISPAQSEVTAEDSDATTTAAITGEADTTVKAPISPAHPEVSVEDSDVTTTAAISGEADTTVKAPISPAHEQEPVTTVGSVGQHEDDSDVTTSKAPIELEKGSDTTEPTADDKHPEPHADDIDVTTAAAPLTEADTTVKATSAPTQAPVEQEKESLPSHGGVTPSATESSEDDKKTESPLDQYTHKPIYDGPGTTEADDVHSSSQTPGYDSGYPSGPDTTGSQYPSAGYPEPEDDYNDEEDPTVFGPGTCRYGGKLYVSAQQIPRDDPCDFCFCFRSDIICLQQSCPPPISGCHEEPINGFCCPRYECPVSMATVMNVTTSTTTTSTTLPPHFLHHAYNGAATRSGCLIQGTSYQVGEIVQSASGPCMHCMCGGDGQMQCEPKVCTPEPMLRQMIAIAAARRR